MAKRPVERIVERRLKHELRKVTKQAKKEAKERGERPNSVEKRKGKIIKDTFVGESVSAQTQLVMSVEKMETFDISGLGPRGILEVLAAVGIFLNDIFGKEIDGGCLDGIINLDKYVAERFEKKCKKAFKLEKEGYTFDEFAPMVGWATTKKEQPKKDS